MHGFTGKISLTYDIRADIENSFDSLMADIKIIINAIIENSKEMPSTKGNISSLQSFIQSAMEFNGIIKQCLQNWEHSEYSCSNIPAVKKSNLIEFTPDSISFGVVGGQVSTIYRDILTILDSYDFRRITLQAVEVSAARKTQPVTADYSNRLTKCNDKLMQELLWYQKLVDLADNDVYISFYMLAYSICREFNSILSAFTSAIQEAAESQKSSVFEGAQNSTMSNKLRTDRLNILIEAVTGACPNLADMPEGEFKHLADAVKSVCRLSAL